MPESMKNLTRLTKGVLVRDWRSVNRDQESLTMTSIKDTLYGGARHFHSDEHMMKAHGIDELAPSAAGCHGSGIVSTTIHLKRYKPNRPLIAQEATKHTANDHPLMQPSLPNTPHRSMREKRPKPRPTVWAPLITTPEMNRCQIDDPISLSHTNALVTPTGYSISIALQTPHKPNPQTTPAISSNSKRTKTNQPSPTVRRGTDDGAPASGEPG